MTTASLDQRLQREIEHFDRHYADEASRGIEPLSAFDRQRYTAPPANTIFPREFYYHLLAPLAGKDVLEIACGNGIDASLCAHHGANVHAYDLSEKSIEMTRQRAAVNGVDKNLQLEVGGDLTQAFNGKTFDAVIGYAALHHLPLPIEDIAVQVRNRLKPGGVAVFAEPMINSRALHALRKCVPIAIAEDTEDEQPLNDSDIAKFAYPFDRVVRRDFQMLSRVWPLFPNSWALAKSLHWLDHQFLKFPFLRRFATVAVFAVYRDQ